FQSVAYSTDIADANAAEGESAAVVALEPDMAFLRQSEMGIRPELARLHFGFPVGAPELVFEQLHPVQPVLNVRTFRYDPRSVPFAHRHQMAWRRRIQGVCRAGAG